MLISAAPGFAVDWSGGAGGGNFDWTNGANWDGGVPPATTESANLVNVDSALRNVHVNGEQTALQLENVTVSGYTITGDTLNLTSEATTPSTDLAFRSSTDITIHNPIHFSSTNLQFLFLSGSGTTTFNEVVSSAGNLETWQLAASHSVLFNNNLEVEGSITWRSGDSTVRFEGTNDWTLWVNARNATYQFASDGAIPDQTTFRDNNFQGGFTTMQAIDQARSYDATFQTRTSGGAISRFAGDHDISFTGGTDLFGANNFEISPIQVEGIRVNMTGDWTQTGAGRGVLLTEDSTGTLVMGADGTTAISYTGTTTVNGGTLLINGVQTGSAGDVTVGAGGTLGGIGTVGGEASVAGTLLAGESGTIGTLTFANGLTMQQDSEITFEFVNSTTAGTTYDQWIGDLILPESGTITLRIVGLAGHSVSLDDSFTLFNGNVTNFSTDRFTIINDSDWTGGWALSEGSLMLTAVPEPNQAVLLGIGLAAILLLRRKHFHATRHGAGRK